MNLSDFGPEVRTLIRGVSKEEMDDLLKRSGIGLEPPHYLDCPTEIQATWRHKHYLARSRRPSVSHRAIKAWFGPTVYYARRSRYKTLAAFPEFVNRTMTVSQALDRMEELTGDFEPRKRYETEIERIFKDAPDPVICLPWSGEAHPLSDKELDDLDKDIKEAFKKAGGWTVRPCWSCPDATTDCLNNCPHEMRLGG
jgi:hypothetical protein